MGLYQAGPEPSGSVLGGLASSDTQIEKPSVEVLCWEEGVPVSNSYKFILEVRCGSEALLEFVLDQEHCLNALQKSNF